MGVFQPEGASEVSAGLCLERVDRFDFTDAAYQQLFSESNATAFQHAIWLDKVYGVLAPAMDARPVIICGKTPGGKLQFILPMVLRRVGPLRIIEPADLGVGDYNSPIVSRGIEPALCQTPHLRARVEALLPPHDLLRIRHIRAEHRELWLTFFSGSARSLDFGAHEVALGDDHAEWQKIALGDSFRRYLERKIRRFHRSGSVSLEELSNPDAVADAVRDMAAVREGRFRNDPIQQNCVREFYADVAAAGVSWGLARTYILNLDGVPVGRVFGLTHTGRFCFLLLACDYENFGRHSPGLVLVDMLLRARRDSGDTIFDFTVGDEPYKADFGSTPQALFVIETPRNLLGAAALKGRATLKAVRKLLQREGASQRRWGEGSP